MCATMKQGIASEDICKSQAPWMSPKILINCLRDVYWDVLVNVQQSQ